MECSVIKAVVSEKEAARAAYRSAQMKTDGAPAQCRLVYTPFWYATFRCELKRFLLPTRTGLVGAGADAFTGFVSLATGLPQTELCDIPSEAILPRRFDWTAVSEGTHRQVLEYFVHEFRRVPESRLEQFCLIHRPIWVCRLGGEAAGIVRCVDAHSGDPLYYLDQMAEEIAALAGM